jgi:hypothetical protein
VTTHPKDAGPRSSSSPMLGSATLTGVPLSVAAQARSSVGAAEPALPLRWRGLSLIDVTSNAPGGSLGCVCSTHHGSPRTSGCSTLSDLIGIIASLVRGGEGENGLRRQRWRGNRMASERPRIDRTSTTLAKLGKRGRPGRVRQETSRQTRCRRSVRKAACDGRLPNL